MLTFMSTTAEPWRDLPPSLADVLEPELPAITQEILAAIADEVPEYAQPLESAFGEALRVGVEQALTRFNMLVRDPDSIDDRDRRASVGLGRAELRAGRTLDALQAAYRVGARVAWRRLATATREAGVDQTTAARLAEAIFAYIDGLSADSVEGYAAAQSERAGELERRRTELVLALLGRGSSAQVPALANALGWRLPGSAAIVLCDGDRLAGLFRRLGAEGLPAHIDTFGCLVYPDAEGPGRRHLVRVAAAGRRVAIGPDVPLPQLPLSWQLATATFELADDNSPVTADDHLGALIIKLAAPVIERIVERRLAGLRNLTPAAQARMTATALAYIQHNGNAAAMGRALHLHPQTARYRIARLRELMGTQLDDADARFEIEAALRAIAVDG
jgi:hypothetical protein